MRKIKQKSLQQLASPIFTPDNEQGCVHVVTLAHDEATALRSPLPARPDSNAYARLLLISADSSIDTSPSPGCAPRPSSLLLLAHPLDCHLLIMSIPS